MSIRDVVLGAVEAAGLDFAVYDRRDDEDLSWRQLEQAIRSGEVTVEEIAEKFAAAVREALGLTRLTGHGQQDRQDRQG